MTKFLSGMVVLVTLMLASMSVAATRVELGLADGPAIDEGYARKPHRLAKYMQTTPP